MSKASVATIYFQAVPYILQGRTIMMLPEDASTQLPSRGQVSVSGVMNGHEFKTVLEPDGRWGHWIRIDAAMQVKAGDTVQVELTPTKEWPEPDVPKDLLTALNSASQKVQDKWPDITPMARWEWVRWINATKNPDTRAIRIEKTISKLDGKHRRPCCFNIAACTDPELSKSGQLITVARMVH